VRRRRPATLVQVALCQPPDRAGWQPAGAAAPTGGLPPLPVGR
jgi:hypothetical protein